MAKQLNILILTALLLFVAVVPGFAQQPTIVEAAVANNDFSTLVAAVQAAGLVDTLSGGNFTVFAPTNGAFNTLLADLGISAEQLLADRALLTTVLTYHVIPGEFKAADILAQDFPFSAPTVQGEAIVVEADPNSDRLLLNGGQATVAITDLDVSNGVIHVLDNVLLPPSVVSALSAPAQPTIVEIAASNNDFTTLVAAVQAAGLVDTLNSGTFTVFAPTNAAFAELLAALDVTAAELLADRALLTTVLTYHVIPGEVPASTIINAGSVSVATVQGQSVTAAAAGGGVQITDATGVPANVIIADLDASNGVVHVIDKVLLPAL
ncbi:MAG: fasciclin domain-containing protein [Chloroflexota bacterium]